jgi:hypothetical protein
MGLLARDGRNIVARHTRFLVVCDIVQSIATRFRQFRSLKLPFNA